MSIKTRAAVLREGGQPWQLEELTLDPPKEREVLIRMMASGLCHSDEHIRESGAARLPLVGGHEGAGIVEEVGPGVTRVAKGDHVVCSFIPACGKCRYCSTGHQNLCNAGLNAAIGCLTDGTFRFHDDAQSDIGGMCVLGTFSQYAVVSEWSCVPIEGHYRFDVACLVGCGVPTGWGSAVYAGGVKAGDTVVVFGCGGVGMNAVQGARFAGAKNVIAVDPLEMKLEVAQSVGATHVRTSADEAFELVKQITYGELADVAVVTVGTMTAEVMRQAVNIVGKGGTVVATAVGSREVNQLEIPIGLLLGYQRRIQGVLCGNTNPLYDIPRLLGLYGSGDLKLEELITQRYTLDQVNEGYTDLMEGRNVRGVIIHEH